MNNFKAKQMQQPMCDLCLEAGSYKCLSRVLSCCAVPQLWHFMKLCNHLGLYLSVHLLIDLHEIVSL